VRLEKTALPKDLPVPKEVFGGRWWIVLSRYAACPFCSLRIDRVARRMAELREANVRLLVVFPSPQERIDKYYPPSSTPFLVVSDTAEKLYDALGAQTSVLGTLRTAIDLPVVVRAELSYRRNPLAIDGPITRQPADYLVRDGTIERIRLGRRLDDGLRTDAVLAWARA